MFELLITRPFLAQEVTFLPAAEQNFPGFCRLDTSVPQCEIELNRACETIVTKWKIRKNKIKLSLFLAQKSHPSEWNVVECFGSL
mmetsp:Transcript_16144/g.32683  ORF Transcript_16144/g.32683 Transcript_16144/m.32683 type:complete len:85 (-) Transcript_16144:1676-1930(-)